VARLADPGRFQAMVWMYIDAAMQLYAVLRPGGDGISADVALLARMKNHQFRVGEALPISSKRGYLWLD
jgi:hypothetical protein